jgi:hypothetical protein
VALFSKALPRYIGHIFDQGQDNTEKQMKYLVIVSALLLGACGTMNAAIDGTQDMVNNTLGGVGNTVADITVAVGQDVKGVVDSGKQDKE